MNPVLKPITKPRNPLFSSGPCTKRPGWSLKNLESALLGRSHRSEPSKRKLAEAIDRTREVLQVPDDYRIAIVPASDTGAVELALWSLLGERGVDVLAWESFGAGWINDVLDQLQLENVNHYEADYGKLPDLTKVNFDHDVVFTWNGTTSGVKVINGDWIRQDRKGLTICDATSAVFAMEIPWDKLDVVTFSWQKVLGGEAAHGMLIISPRTVERLESWKPKWPMPKIFRLTKNGKLNEKIFQGLTINTPSMLCVEDYVDVLKWAESEGGLSGLIARSERSLEVIEKWIAEKSWIGFLAENPETISNTGVCLKIIDPWFTEMTESDQRKITDRLVSLVEAENAGYDFGSYIDAPPGLRIWCGATVETNDVEKLLPWIEWAYFELKGTG
ncbi:MAG: phosphoserine transaminase [Gammaproteobacteria bacterium]